MSPTFHLKLCAVVLIMVPTFCCASGTEDALRSPGCALDSDDRLEFPKGRLSSYHTLHMHDPYNPSGVRKYSIFVPSSYDHSTPTPLILDFHGYMDNAINEAHEDGINIAAEREGFIVLLPNGLQDLPTNQHFGQGLGFGWNNWNGGGTNGSTDGIYGWDMCTDAHALYPCYESCILAGVCKGQDKGNRRDCGWSGCANDEGFIDQLLSKIKHGMCIDEKRVHGTGFSNGAIFLYFLATTTTVGPQLASVVPVSGGVMLGFLEMPKVPMPLLDIHGTKDDTCPANISNSWSRYQNGCPQNIAGENGCTVGDDGWYYEPIHKVFKKWAVANRCYHDADPVVLQTPFDGKTGWSCVQPHGNKCEAQIQFCTHNLGHTWPFHEGQHNVRTRTFGEMIWSFVKDIRRPIKAKMQDDWMPIYG